MYDVKYHETRKPETSQVSLSNINSHLYICYVAASYTIYQLLVPLPALLYLCISSTVPALMPTRRDSLSQQQVIMNDRLEKWGIILPFGLLVSGIVG